MNTYKEVLNSIKKYMILEGNDEYIIDLILSTALSLELDRPIWLMIIAPPSSGKTELLNILSDLDEYHPLYNITPRFLFSGHHSAQGGYMNREVKQRGLIAFPDFTTVLSSNSKTRNEIFNQLRVMYDGKAGLGTGIDTGKYKSWSGKVALISLVTEKIESIKEKSSDLGERFLYFSYFPKGMDEEGFLHMNLDSKIKTQVQSMVKKLIESKITSIDITPLPTNEKKFIYHLSKFIGIGRTTVERDGHRREIANIHRPEEPYRVINALQSLFISLFTINEDTIRTRSILRKIALSSVPNIRARVLVKIQNLKMQKITFDKIYANSKISKSRVRRSVEDLCAVGVLDKIPSGDGNINYIKITENFFKHWEVITRED